MIINSVVSGQRFGECWWTFFFALAAGWTPVGGLANHCAAAAPTASSSPQAAGRENVIKFQVGYPSNLPAGTAQKWLKILADAGADGVRLVLDPDLEPGLTEEKTAAGLTIHVKARINRRQELTIADRRFSIADTADLKAWIQQLKQASSLDPAQQPGAFGLTAEELVKVHDLLGKPYPGSTRGQPVLQVLRALRQHLGIKIGADEVALARFREEESGEWITRVPEEMQGLSCGTVLAAVIRPLGLVLVVEKGGQRLNVMDSKNAREHWPVGWPIQERPSQIAPVLFQQTDVEIEGFKLDEVLRAIEAKTGIPFVFDQNSMAREGIELDRIEVNLGRTRTYYDKLIRLCLNESRPRLKSELRADERGQPFLWISP